MNEAMCSIECGKMGRRNEGMVMHSTSSFKSLRLFGMVSSIPFTPPTTYSLSHPPFLPTHTSCFSQTQHTHSHLGALQRRPHRFRAKNQVPHMRHIRLRVATRPNRLLPRLARRRRNRKVHRRQRATLDSPLQPYK